MNKKTLLERAGAALQRPGHLSPDATLELADELFRASRMKEKRIVLRIAYDPKEEGSDPEFWNWQNILSEIDLCEPDNVRLEIAGAGD